MNIVDGSKDERAYTLKVRSMSVGDLVVLFINNVTYYLPEVETRKALPDMPHRSIRNRTYEMEY